MMNKKGISPLIATVLILGFTIALAAIVMTWGKSFTQGLQESTEKSSESAILCATEINFKVKNVCLDSNNKYKITVENNGQRDIKYFDVRYYKSPSDVVTGKISFDEASQGNGIIGITKFGVESDVDDILTSYGGVIKEVEMVPTIEIGGSEMTCQDTKASFGDQNAAQSPIVSC